LSVFLSDIAGITLRFGATAVPSIDPLPTEADSRLAAAPAGDRNLASHQGSRRRGWSVNGAERSQTVATPGKPGRPKNGPNKPKPLPPVAVSCAHKHMVRRGSTVRVRQRALFDGRIAREWAVFGCLLRNRRAPPLKGGGQRRRRPYAAVRPGLDPGDREASPPGNKSEWLLGTGLGTR
jgi:hypothetical protein